MMGLSGRGDKQRAKPGVKRWFVSLASVAIVVGLPAQAAAPMTGAEKLHRLDIMLKVSGARCEGSASDLRADYAAFVRNHRFALSQASREIRLKLAARTNAARADRAYERMNLELTDEYRHRHPWLSCEELKVATHGLAMVEGSATLLEAADQILPDGPLAHLAMLRRE